MSHNSSKNRTVSIIFDTSNCPSTLDTLPYELLIWQSTSYIRCHDNEADDNSDVIK